MRRSTLKRCHADWLSHFKGTSSRSFEDDIASVLKLFGDELTWFPDDEHPIQRLAVRELELNRSPSATQIHPTELDDKRVLAFSSVKRQAAFIEAWLKQEASAPAIKSGNGAEVSWAHVHYLISAEALRQCTWHLRSHGGDEGAGLTVFLRVAVTVLVHGLASLGLPASAFPDFSAANDLFGPPLPAERAKRYRFLVSHIYRHLIEDQNWRLGRSLGRSDLRLDLLTLIVNPSATSKLFKIWTDDASTASLPDYPFEGRKVHPDRQVAPELKENKRLWSELVEAIGRAGADLDGTIGTSAVEWALLRLPNREAPVVAVDASLPQDNEVAKQLLTSSTKLRIDWLQSRDTEESLTDAEELCLGGLGRLGIPIDSLSERLFEATEDALRKARANKRGVRADILKALHAAQREIEQRTREPTSREEAVDLLFRWGELLATRADELSKPSEEDGQQVPDEEWTATVALAFSKALAVYWAADRVRSGIVQVDGQGVRWPRASPRPMRYFVRVLLKLARLFSKERPQPDQSLYRLTTNLLELSQSRIEVYTRHNYQFSRERDSMLTLEAIRLRAWTRVIIERSSSELVRATDAANEATEAKQARPGTLVGVEKWEAASAALDAKRTQFREDFGRCRKLLARCWDLLDQSERRLISLGLRPGHLRRLLLERIKSAVALLQLAVSQRDLLPMLAADEATQFRRQVDRHRVLALHDLEQLTAVSQGRPFYANLAKRQKIRLDASLKALTLSDQS